MKNINIKQIKAIAVEKLRHWAVTVKAELQSPMQLSAIALSTSVDLISLVAVFCGWFVLKGN